MSDRHRLVTVVVLSLGLLAAFAYSGLVGYWWSTLETREHIMYATWDRTRLPYDDVTLAPYRRHASIMYLRLSAYDPDSTVEPGLTLLQFALNEYEAAAQRGKRDGDRVLKTADARGPMLGDTAMHNAVLYNEPAVVKFLLSLGASTRVTIHRPEHQWHGLTPMELAAWLNLNASHISPDWSEVHTILQDWNADKDRM